MPALGVRIPATALRRFWEMLAHYHGQLWNASKIGGSLGVTAPTAKHYLDTLEDTFMLRQLPPFASNLKKRLVKSPKIYLRDSGLLHALLRIGSHDDLLKVTRQFWKKAARKGRIGMRDREHQSGKAFV